MLKEAEIRTEAVEWFSVAMMEKLSRPKNLAKEHWRRFSFQYLFNRILDESEELNTELLNLQNYYEANRLEKVIDEAVDVANIAMMVADNARYELSFLTKGDKLD